MPNRMLRDWTDSEKFDGMNAETERLFVRLIMKADDYGRFHADTRLVATACFPMGDMSAQRIAPRLAELQLKRLVIIYVVARRRYLAIVNYGQRLKQSRAKFPAKEGMGSDWLATSGDIPPLPGTSGNFPSESEVESEAESESESESESEVNPKRKENTNPALGGEYTAEFLEFWKAYPKKKAKDDAWRAWKARNGSRPDIANIIVAVALQSKSDDWIKDGGKYIPHPATWINQGRWSDEATEIKKGFGRG